MIKAQFLWEQLLDRLDRDGLLAQQTLKSTPAEIAKRIRSRTGDQRVHRFVWGYYYPRLYGNEVGSMSELEAEAIIESFNRPVTKLERTVMEKERQYDPADGVAQESLKLCRICGTRPTIIGDPIG